MATSKAYGPVLSVEIDSSSLNIPTTYAGTNGLALSSCGYPRRFNAICIVNNSSKMLAICTVAQVSGVPASDSTNASQIYCPANSFVMYDKMAIYDSVYVRAVGGAVAASGVIAISLFSE